MRYDVITFAEKQVIQRAQLGKRACSVYGPKTHVTFSVHQFATSTAMHPAFIRALKSHFVPAVLLNFTADSVMRSRSDFMCDCMDT